jgi:hypothetical protein
MSMKRARTRVTLPVELVAEIDSLVGPRGRSRYITEATAERLQRERTLKALEIGFGAWKDEDHPELNGPGGTEGWVRRMREGDNRRLEDLLRE